MYPLITIYYLHGARAGEDKAEGGGGGGIPVPCSTEHDNIIHRPLTPRLSRDIQSTGRRYNNRPPSGEILTNTNQEPGQHQYN